MIHLFLQRLLLSATPLFSAAVKGKAKQRGTPVKKKIARRTIPARSKRVKPVKRAAHSTTREKNEKKKPAERARITPLKKTDQKKLAGRAPIAPPKKAEQKPTPRPPAQPASAQDLPKPVAPSGRALLLSPENGKFTDSVHPRFRWLSVGGAARYQIEWSDKPDFSESYASVSIATEAVVPVEKPLRIGGLYYWRVRGGNEGGWGPWSAPASFRVLEETE